MAVWKRGTGENEPDVVGKKRRQTPTQMPPAARKTVMLKIRGKNHQK